MRLTCNQGQHDGAEREDALTVAERAKAREQQQRSAPSTSATMMGTITARGQAMPRLLNDGHRDSSQVSISLSTR